jgi:hypothetical protein
MLLTSTADLHPKDLIACVVAAQRARRPFTWLDVANVRREALAETEEESKERAYGVFLARLRADFVRMGGLLSP